MSKCQVEIRSDSDLDRLPYPGLHPNTVEVRIVAEGFDDARRIELENRLSTAMSHCGCAEGGMFGVAYLVVVGVLIVAGSGPTTLAAWSLAVAGSVVALLTGKLVGLGRARVGLARHIADARALIVGSSSPMKGVTP